MTTAHRPTWKAAVGRSDEGGWSAGGAPSAAVSALDLPSHTSLKVRKGSQLVGDRRAALQKSLLELEQAEQTSKSGIPMRQYDPKVEEEAKVKLLKQTAEVDEVQLKAKYDDSDVDDGGGGSGGSDSSDLDKDADESDLDASDSDGDDSSDSDDEDDAAALEAELAKIRAEREQAKQRAEERAAEEEEAKLEEAALLGNPLLNESASVSSAGLGSGKKRGAAWNDDVVFRNQAKGEPAPKKRFINDTVRNDFHRRFLNKFMR